MGAQAEPHHWTVADLPDEIPHELGRHEIIDGELVVTSAPRTAHQAAIMALILQMSAAGVTRVARVLPGPIDVTIADDVLLLPDVVVVLPEDAEHLGEQGFTGPPSLVVEVLSPSTAARDLGVKRDRYAAFGVPDYWVVDLDAARLLVFTLRDGTYGERTSYGPDDTVEVAGRSVDLGPVLAAAER